MTLRLPSKHLNGSHWPDLQNEALAALEAAQNLTAKVQAMTVHGRDFTPQGASAFIQADAAKRLLLIRLDGVERLLREYAEGLHNGGHKGVDTPVGG